MPIRRAPLYVAALLFASACGPAESDAPRCGDLRLERPVIVLEGDERSASALGRIDQGGCVEEVADVVFGVDSSLSEARGRRFVCNRTSGECFEIEPGRLALRGAYVASRSVDDPSANPHDLTIDGEGGVWIARYDRPSLAVLAADGSYSGEVSLASFDSDGTPEAEAIHSFDHNVYVALERLDEYRAPKERGMIAVVDAKSREVSGSFELIGQNPFGRMVPMQSDPTGGTVAIATPGSFSDAGCASCGAELVDLAARTSRQILREQELGGSVSQVLVASETEGYAIVAGPEEAVNPTWVVRFDPSTAEVTAILADTRDRPETERGYFHWGLALNGDMLLVGDRTKDRAAVRAFSRQTGAALGSFPVGIYPPIALLTL